MVASNEYVLTAINNTQYIVKKEANGFIVENTKGKVIIFDIFATWCPPCKAEATHLMIFLLLGVHLVKLKLHTLVHFRQNIKTS